VVIQEFLLLSQLKGEQLLLPSFEQEIRTPQVGAPPLKEFISSDDNTDVKLSLEAQIFCLGSSIILIFTSLNI
jgi:hypothetical protein